MTYYLNTPKNKTSIVMIKYSYQNQRKQFSTGLKIVVNDWSKKKQRVKTNSIESVYATAQNAQLNQWEIQIDNILRNAKMMNYSFDKAKQEILNIFGKADKSKRKLSLKEFIPEWIEMKSKVVTEGRARHYRSMNNMFNKYLKDRNVFIDFEDVDIYFLTDFRQWFYERGLLESTVAGKFKIFKQFMDAGYEAGHHSSQKYKPKDFKFSTSKKSGKLIYIRDDEKKRLLNANFKDRASLDRCRDRLILEIETGLRCSDLADLSSDNVREIEGKWFIIMETWKTMTDVKIEMTDNVLNIYKKYENGFPPKISNQPFNNRLKEIGKKIKMNEIETWIEIRAGKKKRVKQKRHELLSTHAGRRTFATQSRKAGKKLEWIQKRLGHSNIEQTIAYIHPDAYGDDSVYN